MGIVGQIDEAEGKLSFFDTRVTEPRVFASEKDLSEMMPEGGRRNQLQGYLPIHEAVLPG